MKKVMILCAVIMALCFFAVGCQEDTQPQEPLTLSLSENIKAAQMGKNYALKDLFVEQEGVQYSFQVSYVDALSGEENEIPISEKLKFMQEYPADVKVTITAVRGQERVSKEISIPVVYDADIIDCLLSTGGKAGYADPGVTKALCFDTSYLKHSSSKTSLAITFTGAAEDGVTILDLCHYSMIPYYSARVWNDAVVSFWVFNPMQEDIELRLKIKDGNAKININWNSPSNTQVQYAKAGEWTQVFFSLKQYGVDGLLYMDEDLTRNDILEVQAQYQAAEPCNLYIDCLDVIPAYQLADVLPDVEIPAQPIDLLQKCKVTVSSLGSNGSYQTVKTSTNGSEDAFRIAASAKAGYPMIKLKFRSVTDISGYDFLRFDVKATNASPWTGIYLKYLDKNGKEQSATYYADFKEGSWRSVNIPLHMFTDADLTRVTAIHLCVNFSDGFREGAENELLFDNVYLTTLEASAPSNQPALMEDDDLISGPFQWNGTGGILEGRNGIIKVSEDENGKSRSNSALVFWANTTSGYPRASFFFDAPQDWSDVTEMYIDTRMENAYGWVSIDLITFDEDGMIDYIQYTFDAINSAWNTHVIPIQWFDTAELPLIYGIRLTCNLDGYFVSGTVSKVYIDNLYIERE